MPNMAGRPGHWTMEMLRESETTIKIKFALFRGGLGRVAERKMVQNAIFHGKRHDNKILKVKILLSRNFVVMAHAPKCGGVNTGRFGKIVCVCVFLTQF